MIYPLLEAVLQSLSYTISCDVAENALPGYHLVSDSRMTEYLSNKHAIYNPHEKLVTGSVQTAAMLEESSSSSTTLQFAYIKKYSRGTDDLRYINKAVDALASVIHCYDIHNVLDYAVMKALLGSTTRRTVLHHSECHTQTVAARCFKSWLPRKHNPTAAALQSKLTMSTDSNKSSDVGGVTGEHCTPLLEMPLLDCIILCVAISKSAPTPTSSQTTDSMDTVSCKSDASSNNNDCDNSNYYNPLWNTEHSYRWICLARLVQLLLLSNNSEIENNRTGIESSATSSSSSFVISEWPCLAGYLLQLLHMVETKSLDNSFHRPTSVQLREILWQWLVFLRTTAHLLYRIRGIPSSEIHRHSCLLSADCWLEVAAEGVLLQNSSELRAEHLRQHLVMLSMEDLLDITPLQQPCDASNNNDDDVNITSRTGLLSISIAANWVDDWLRYTATATTISNSCNEQQVPTESLKSCDVDTITDSIINDKKIAFAERKVSSDVAAFPVVLIPTSGNTSQQQQLLLQDSYLCYPRSERPALINLPEEYTKLHADIMNSISNHPAAQELCNSWKNNSNSTANSNSLLKPFEFPALCLICGAVVDAGGRGQCAAHCMQCGGESGIFFLLQVIFIVFEK